MCVSSGVINVARRSDEPQASWELHFPAWRPRLLRRLGLPDPVVPVAGLMAASHGSLYAFAGARIERPLGGRWTFSPSFAAGLYYRDRGKELGLPLEFRSGLELSYRLRGDRRLGVVLYHLSNGGLSDSNPGTEALMLTYRAGLR